MDTFTISLLFHSQIPETLSSHWKAEQFYAAVFICIVSFKNKDMLNLIEKPAAEGWSEFVDDSVQFVGVTDLHFTPIGS